MSPEEMDRAKAYWEGTAATIVTKSREMSRVEAYVKSGVTHARISTVDDHRRSEVCEFLDGKVVPVELMVKLRDELLTASSPEDVKRIKPWLKMEEVKRGVKGNTVTDYRLAFPDFHFFCRSRTVVNSGVRAVTPNEEQEAAVA